MGKRDERLRHGHKILHGQPETHNHLKCKQEKRNHKIRIGNALCLMYHGSPPSACGNCGDEFADHLALSWCQVRVIRHLAARRELLGICQIVSNPSGIAPGADPFEPWSFALALAAKRVAGQAVLLLDQRGAGRQGRRSQQPLGGTLPACLGVLRRPIVIFYVGDPSQIRDDIGNLLFGKMLLRHLTKSSANATSGCCRRRMIASWPIRKYVRVRSGA